MAYIRYHVLILILQEIGDFCDDTLSVYVIQGGKEHLINSLHHDNNVLIMVENEHIQIVFTSCVRTYLQTAHGFLAQVTYQGMFGTNNFRH